MGHVNTAHGENKPFKPNRIGKGKLIETEDDIILNMEHDYGGIRTEREYDEDKGEFIRKLICNKCGHGGLEKDSIKKHIQKALCRQMVKITKLNASTAKGRLRIYDP